ncbi:hypothetical protein [Prevotella melaninogenica]
MKRLFFLGLITLFFVSCASSLNSEKIDTLKEQQKVLKMTTELNKLQLDYEKEKANNVELSKKAADINVEANVATTEFSTTNASNTVKDAKSTIKRLKEAKSINKKLAKSQRTLSKMERKIAKLQAKIDDCNKRIKFVNNNN